MFQKFQYFIKGIVFKKFYMNPGNDNDIHLLIDLFTENSVMVYNVCKTFVLSIVY